jgi:hypothetical protein
VSRAMIDMTTTQHHQCMNTVADGFKQQSRRSDQLTRRQGKQRQTQLSPDDVGG